MASGTVKWFNSEKDFGFIEQDGEGPDLFAHYSEISGSGYRELAEGEHVTFEIGQSPRRSACAEHRPRLTGRQQGPGGG
ncbi:CspA family cold shock protein [Streptomyces tendae]